MIERAFTIIMLIVFAVLVIMLAQQVREINELQDRINSRQITVTRAEDYLPEGFTVQDAAYQAACQRYEIEQGHVIPGQKETAPESANSEADRCKGAS